MYAAANKSREPKCAGRDVHLEMETSAYSTITVLAGQLHINEEKILGTVAKFTTMNGM